MDEPLIIDTPEGIEHFYFAGCIAALRIEVHTGMVHSRGSVLASVRRNYGVKARTKKEALKEMEDMYEKTYGRKYGS